jgi:acetyltransferase
MSTYRLDKLFSPRSASPRETSPGRAVLRNLRAAGFEGSVSLVNPRYGEIEGIKAVKTIQELPQAPDLLVIATPPQSVPGIVAAAGEKVRRLRSSSPRDLDTAKARSPMPARRRPVPPD